MTESGSQQLEFAAWLQQFRDASNLADEPNTEDVSSHADDSSVEEESSIKKESSYFKMLVSGAQQQTNLLREILDLHKSDQQKKIDKEIRSKQKNRLSFKRQLLVDAAGALAIVAALIGGGVLEVLLSPAWAQIGADSALGACQDRGNCEMWRSFFVITASTAFSLSIIVLLMTLGGEFSLKECLFINFSSTFICFV